jgi:hypothetical protein
VPNGVYLGPGANLRLITGPNASGASTRSLFGLGWHDMSVNPLSDVCYNHHPVLSSAFLHRAAAVGAGKTTYVKQVGLTLVLAHLGCYVPAQAATVRLTDRVLTRVSPHRKVEGLSLNGAFARGMS